MTRFSCARHSRERGEPLDGTASTVRRWILVEQPGTWGRDALTQSRLGVKTGEALRHLAFQLRAKVLLVRRHDREEDERMAFLAYSGRNEWWLEAFRLDRAADLLSIDLTPLARGEPVGGRQLERPLYLVCTNGRHDACCAEYGRPLFDALDTLVGEHLWECSHVGGDRFAGNLVCLPSGVYYGRVTPEDAKQVVLLHEEGRVALDHYRGRSAYPFAVQAAESAVRRLTGNDRLEGVTLVRARWLERGRTLRAAFKVDGERHQVVLEVEADPDGQQLTCDAEHALRPPRYRVARIDD